MDFTVSLDSFQLIVGIYLVYVTIKGHGTMYNFFDIPDRLQAYVRPRLRLIYGICAVLALTEAALCMWAAGSSRSAAAADLAAGISSGLTFLIVLLLIGVIVWLRKLTRR